MNVKGTKETFTAYVDKVTHINSLFNDSKTTVIYIKYILTENTNEFFIHKARLELNMNHGLIDISVGDNIEFEAVYLHSIEEGWLKIGKPYKMRKVN
jgi:hypothetical protein